MESLVQKYPCHIATSASVLQQLLDNHPPDFSVAWDTPVVIKDYGSGAGMPFLIHSESYMLSSHVFEKTESSSLHQIWVSTPVILKVSCVLELITSHTVLACLVMAVQFSVL